MKTYSQDLHFPGVAPSFSFSALINKKFDLNFLAASKIRTGQHIIKEVQYQPLVLEIYTQALLSYKINKHWQTAAGYGFQRNNPFENDWRNEHRLIQQLSYTTTADAWRLYNRIRFEERWFSYPSANNQFSTRARYQAGLVKNFSNKTYWHFNNEIYVIPSHNRNSFISENWVYSGIGFPVYSFGRMEAGMGYNTVVRNANKDDLNLFLLQVSWSYIIPSAKMMNMHPVMHSRHF